MKKLFLLILVFTILYSCDKIPEKSNDTFLSGKGVFIINEGNFRWGNGSLSFYSYDSVKIYNDLFQNVNERPLGDVPNSIVIHGDRAYIIVNNSGKIEVVDKNTLESLSTITGLNSPRNIAVVSNSKAYVTSMYSDSVTIINLTDNNVQGYINLKKTSESLIVSGTNAYISNWVGGSKIMVVNTENDIVSDSINVGAEPESMVLDKNKMLWVLCNGGWTRTVPAELNIINTSINKVTKEIVFPDKFASPSCLSIDGKGETIYYLENGVKQMSINSVTLPIVPLISLSGHYFYKLGVNPANNDIFVTDAVDYQQKGTVYYYKKDGTLISTLTADIIPGSICFKE